MPSTLQPPVQLEELETAELDEDDKLELEDELEDELSELELELRLLDDELDFGGGRFGFFPLGRHLRNSRRAIHNDSRRTSSSANVPNHSSRSISKPSKISARMIAGTIHQYFSHHHPPFRTSSDGGKDEVEEDENDEEELSRRRDEDELSPRRELEELDFPLDELELREDELLEAEERLANEEDEEGSDEEEDDGSGTIS